MSSSTPSARITRLNSIMRQLLFNKEVDSRTLWELSGPCSRRTFERDMEYLRDEHCAEITYDASRRTYSLRNKSSFLPTIPMTETEVLGLTAGIRLAEHLLPYLKDDMMSLWSRIKTVVPGDITRKGEVFGRSSVIAMPQVEVNPRILDILIDSIQKKRPVMIKYRNISEDRLSQVFLSPWWLFFKYHSWHVLGGRCDHGVVVSYPLSSIDSAMAWDDLPYADPPEIDRSCLADSFWLGKPGDKAVPIKIMILPPLSETAPYTIWHPTQRVITMADDSVSLEASIPESAMEDVARWILARAPLALPIYPKRLATTVERLSSELNLKIKGLMNDSPPF